MMAKVKRLGIWLDGVCIADLEQTRFPGIRCRYSEEALRKWPLNSPVISCSLPLEERPLDALAFCKGLLPEGQALQAMSAQAQIPTNDTFELLARFGRDVAGALILSEDEPSPANYGVERYSDNSLAGALFELEEHPLGTHDDSELSLAGLEDKLVLVKLDGGGWGRPLHGLPSTHILKLDNRRLPGLVDAEASCLGLAKDLGLTTVDWQTETLGSIVCLIVSRYDRERSDAGVTRIHQEDLCQAMGINPAMAQGRGKYQRAGGPRLSDAAQLLDTYAEDPERELGRLAAAMTFTVLIGNADAHGKNLSLIHRNPTSVELAPLYDTVPTLLWSELRTQGAMTIGPMTELSAVRPRDLLSETGAWGLAESQARAVVAGTLEQTLDALDRGVIEKGSKLADEVRRRAEALAGDL